MTIHQSPPNGAGTMPCCGRTPYEASLADRMTLDSSAVTCARTDVPSLRMLVAERLSNAIQAWEAWSGDEVDKPADCDMDWSLDEYLADVATRTFVDWLPTPAAEEHP